MNTIKLNINGKEVSAKLGTQFLMLACESEGVELTELLAKLQTEALFLIPKLMFYATETSARREGIENPITLGEIFDFIDSEGVQSKVVASFLQVLNDSVMVHLPKEEGKDQPQKKAAPKK